MRISAAIVFLIAVLTSTAQILDITPTFPTVDDEITIIYDATQGNAALVGVSPVYAHMGLITDESATPNDWQFVVGEWGTDDADVLMEDLGNDLHQIVVDIDQFYGFPNGTEVLQLAFVFRDEEGDVVGRDTDGSDIFYDMADESTALQAAILSPAGNLVVDNGEEIEFSGSTNIEADIELFDNGELIASEDNATQIEYTLTVSGSGSHDVVMVATSGAQVSTDTVNYVINGTVPVADPPPGTQCGANYHSPSSVTISLYAPGKDYMYLIGDFNGWEAHPDYFMNRSVDGTRWWLTLTDLVPGQRYAYQYWVDGQGKYADPCSELILDPWNDPMIDSETYPDPLPYPSGLTSGNCSVIHMDAPEFDWQHDNYDRPDKTKLVIYEMLVRDFIEAHNYTTLIDTLDYLEHLGVNAIELMPPGEFEGNESWGYNPSFHMALDKYYGTPEAFKSFVDACHERGIAVIVDMVLNHVFGQGPHAQLYWDPTENAPSANNPWLNQECPSEPFCWGSDYNHENTATQRYVDRVNTHWLEEYHIDGFRFDYTSGFHNGPAGGYSETRIGLIQRMADVVWSVDPEAYVILEHWCDNNEESQLSDYGCLLWGNVTHQYQESAMGWLSNSNFEWGVWQQRGWNDQHLISYPESHDEERITYKTLQFGNSSGAYDTQELLIAMARNELNAVMYLAQPGPKMIWQFAELGYDVSIDFDCRTCPKPIRWYYFDNNARKKLYDVFSAMNGLRRDYPAFTTTNIDYSFSGAFKRLNLYHPDMDVVVIGNFDVTEQSGLPNFPYTGTWYDYFSGTSIVEDNLANEFLLQPGEYRVYTSEPLPQPDLAVSLEESTVLQMDWTIGPNPTAGTLQVSFDLIDAAQVELLIMDAQGRMVDRMIDGGVQAGEHRREVDLSDVAAGQYWMVLAVNGAVDTQSFTIER